MNRLQRRKPNNLSDKNLTPIFIYGTLKNPHTRDMVLHKKEDASPITLSGYKRTTYTTPEGKDFHSIEESSNSKVPGDLMEVSDDELRKLITWEDQYDLKRVHLSNGQDARAFILKNEDKK